MSVKSLLVKSIFSSWPSMHSGSARPAQPHRDTVSASVNNSNSSSISMSISTTANNGVSIGGMEELEEVEEVGEVLERVGVEVKEEEVEQEVADLGVGHQTGLDLS